MASVFNDLVKFNENGEIFSNQWVEWDHFLIPNKLQSLRNIMRCLLAIFGHCMICTALDGCYFLSENKPEFPMHKNCDCQLYMIEYKKVKNGLNSELPIEKLSKYIFGGEKQSKGKQAMFESWGYKEKDSSFLKKEFENQAKENYLKGNYILKTLDSYGQRISIPINLNGNIFFSGWMVCPEGKIRNTTPFGGWLK